MGLHGLKETPNNKERKSTTTEDILKMLEFVLRYNYFEFNGKVKKQLLGVAIGTICAPPYACIFMDILKTGFLKVKNTSQRSGLFILIVSFLFQLRGEKKLQQFLKKPIKTIPT